VFSNIGSAVWLYSALQLRPAVLSQAKWFRKPLDNNANIARHATTFSIRFPVVHLDFYPPLFMPALVNVVRSTKQQRHVRVTIVVMLCKLCKLT
jgi:hypothetical protein